MQNVRSRSYLSYCDFSSRSVIWRTPDVIFASARGRLLLLNLLVVAVTLMVSGVAVMGFRHASQMQELVQQQTVDDMTGSLNLARDTANVATAAVRLSQVVGALEYKGEAERLQETQRALKARLHNWRTRL